MSEKVETIDEMQAGLTGMVMAVREARDKGVLTSEQATDIVTRGVELTKALWAGHVVSYQKGKGAEVELIPTETLEIGGDE